MQVAAVQAAPESVRAFIQEYFDAWKGTDEDKILAYYSDNVVIHFPTGTLEGKTAVRDNFVRPFVRVLTEWSTLLGTIATKPARAICVAPSMGRPPLIRKVGTKWVD
jgi:ketosteroid isomerase-like protein